MIAHKKYEGRKKLSSEGFYNVEYIYESTANCL